MKTMKSDNYIWQMLLAAFFLSGFLHVVLYGVPYTDSIVQIFDGTVILLWMVTIVRRIVDRRVRNFMVLISIFIVSFFAFQMCKYKLFTGDTAALRFVWYCFYIPMCMIPLLLFYISLYMNHSIREAFSKKWLVLFVMAVLLCIGVLTNDLHFLAFRFPNGLSDATGVTGTYKYGPLYFLIIAWEVILVVSSLVIILRKCGTSAARKYIVLPAATLAAGAILMLLGVVGLSPKIHGVTVWQLTETYIFMVVLFLESCIRIGMIPANTGYERLFGLLSMPAAIYDAEGKVAVASANAITADGSGADMKIETMDIYGGRVAWALDLKEVNSLNKQIVEVTSQIESRNARLLSENQMKEEQAALEARNRLYDRIADIVSPQLHRIEELLETKGDTDFDKTIAEINVLNAYIKRRSNMELLKADEGVLPVSELIMAIRESMNYLEDTGVKGSVSAISGEELPTELLIHAYELFEDALESCLGKAKMVAVFLTCKDQRLRIRLMIEDKEETEEKERVITILLPEGGAS